jgi:endonuclease/exonuclease/phosphatase family metal-dependent hydrolase
MEHRILTPCKFSRLEPVVTHLNDQWKPAPQSPRKLESQTLAIVSYNVWFGNRTETLDEYAPRINELIQVILREGADIICLQEVTDNILILFLENESIRERYWTSHTRAYGYQTAILSTMPCSSLYCVNFVTNLGRNLLVAEFMRPNEERFCVATVHLESYAQDYDTRDQQLATAKEVLLREEYKFAFLCGDFNFADRDERERQLRKMGSMKDTWSLLHPAEDGFTFDTKRNLLTQSMVRAYVRNRIDIVLWKDDGSQSCVPKEMKLLGTEPILNNPKLFPSDHFGVYALFQFI